MKVAIYEILSDIHRYKYVKEADDYAEKSESYIRVTDIKEVDFEMTDDAFIIPKKVEALRAEAGKVAAEFEEKIGKLLAITHQPEEDNEPLFGIDVKQDAEGEATKPYLDVTQPIEGKEEGTA